MSYVSEDMGARETVGGITLFESMRSNHLVTPKFAGLMSAQDKVKLDGIEEKANNYSHPLSPLAPGRYLFVTVDEYGHAVEGKVIEKGTLEEHEITDAYIADGEVHLGQNVIIPLTAESELATDKLTGVIRGENLPDVLADYGIADLHIKDGTVTIGENSITPLTAESELAADAKAIIERFKDSIPYTQGDKERVDTATSTSDKQSYLFRKTTEGNVVLRSLYGGDSGGDTGGDGGDTDEDTDTVIASSSDVAQLIAKFSSTEKDSYDEVIADDSDTQQLVDKFD